MKAQLEEEWGARSAYAVDAGWSVLLACWLAGAVAIAAAYHSRAPLDETLQKSANGKVFSVFGAIYVFSFAIGSNWDYRLIFMLPTLPFALEMVRNRARRRWAIAYVAAVLSREIRWTCGASTERRSFASDDFFLFLMVLAILTQQYKALLQKRENWGFGKRLRCAWARSGRAGRKGGADVRLRVGP